MNDDLLKQLTKNRVAMIKTQGAIAQVEATISQAIAAHKTKLEKLRKNDAELQGAIKVAMEESGTKKFENEVLSITYIAPSTRSVIDVTKLREEQPDIAERFSKTSDVASSIRIKVKE